MEEHVDFGLQFCIWDFDSVRGCFCCWFGWLKLHNYFFNIVFLCPSLFILKSYLPTPPLGQDMTQGQFLSSLTGLNSVFLLLDKLPHQGWRTQLPYYLPIAGGRIIGFIPFPRVLVLCEMQSVSSRIWTRVAMSISYDDNHYTTSTSTVYFELVKVKLMTVVEGNLNASFLVATSPRWREGCFSFPWIAPLYPWSMPYNAEQGGIKYHVFFLFFFSLWYDLTWDWTLVFWAIGKHSTHVLQILCFRFRNSIKCTCKIWF